MEDVHDDEFVSTARNINQYADVFGMTKEGFFDWLKHKKKVLNIASGGGVLEKEFELEKENTPLIETQIYSLDILYSKSLEFPRTVSNLLITEEDISNNRVVKKLKKMNDSFEKRSAAGNFYILPFGDNTFEGVLASYAFVHINDPKKLGKLYKEIYRVLKPGGESLITIAKNIVPTDLPFE